MSETAKHIDKLLYDKENGLLIKYRFKQGIDMDLLDKLYDLLEQLKNDWKERDSVPKEIIFRLVVIVPALYRELPIYANDSKFYSYEEVIYCLDNAIAMCVNPNTNDEHFGTPLRELGF